MVSAMVSDNFCSERRSFFKTCYSKIVRIFVSMGADVYSNGHNILHIAAREGKFDIVKVLLDIYKLDVNIKSHPFGQTAIHLASDNGHLNIVKFLLQRGADVSCSDLIKKTPLHMATEKGHSRIVEELMSSGHILDAKNIEDKTPLHIAAKFGHISIAEVLLKFKADIHSRDCWLDTPLHIAVRNMKTSLTEFLLASGADAELTNIDQYSSLQLAAHVGNFECVRIILQRTKIDINWKSGCRKTALHLASQGGHSEIVKFLLKEGANCDSVDDMNNTPLHLASCNTNILCESKQLKYHSIVKELLYYGADVNARGFNDNTPMHFAALIGHLSIVTLLKSCGGDPHALNYLQETPLDLAKMNNTVSIL